MQSDQQLFPPNPAFPISPISNQVGGSYMHNAPDASAFGGPILPAGLKHSGPIHGIEFQPSEVCPKNFIIFDQSQNRSQIMFHPVIAPQFCYPGFNTPSYIHDNVEREANTEKEAPSSLREDSADIDALLSLEEEEQEECDEEEVSTARTHGDYGSDSSDSCSSYRSKPKKSRLSSSQKSSGSGNSCNSERKRQKMKKMVKVLQGIVPGGNRMNTVAVLDEAVRYLKSLKIEAQKLGVTNLS
ncbi:hypothetical protein Acr_00g0046110 [Actinidia rufa]|uniref:BHLH domain-containing protein n=1 Tax=Actinidia rufa TaxID=165716 RepID=A0A7J0DJC4_9ERIC|nr:hypothetical protein Acr_00g0046110 [Actinidia rufa]